MAFQDFTVGYIFLGVETVRWLKFIFLILILQIFGLILNLYVFR